jgi:molybdopterin/thiamine biosynthesis adenylyltransferase
MNRQWAALGSTMDKPKLEVYAQWAREINPEVELNLFPEGLNLDNVQDFMRGADVYLGAMDLEKDREAKEKSSKIASQLGIPIFTCGALGFGAIMVNHDPWGMKPQEFWQRVQEKSPKTQVMPSLITDLFDKTMMQRLKSHFEETGNLATLASGAGQAGLMVGNEIVIHLLQGTDLAPRIAIFAPRFVTLDLFTLQLNIVDVSK